MDNMGTKHIFLFLAGAAAGAFAMHLHMGPKLSLTVVTPKLVSEAVKGLSAWH